MAWPNRVVVLESAVSSARAASNFKHIDQLRALLEKFVTLYWLALVHGGGDNDAHCALGWGYASDKGQASRSTTCMVRERTFRYEGKDLVMWKHLRIGTKETPAETIRIHFEWDAAKQLLVIGWCGAHLHGPQEK